MNSQIIQAAEFLLKTIEKDREEQRFSVRQALNRLEKVIAIDKNELRTDLSDEDIRRFSFEINGSNMFVCRGLHGKHEPCDFIPIMPEMMMDPRIMKRIHEFNRVQEKN